MTDGIKPWGAAEKEAWFASQKIQRSYQTDVVDRLTALPPENFALEQYGALSHDPQRYPLYVVKSKPWDDANPTILITGGVHGYEDSGITGALRFLEEEAAQYADKVNFVVYPCISPLGYEINHRWNRKAEDPNRHFFAGGTAEESRQLMASVESLKLHFRAAVDLHETNYRDIGITAERRARDGQKFEAGDDYIPDGFYLVVPSQADVALGHEVIEAVRKVTPIAIEPEILGYKSDKGVIVIDDVNTLLQDFARQHADVGMTTEIYPDKATRKEAEDAQIATIKAVIAHSLKNPAPK
ncbi:MAG: M14 family metallocarboxypeptidase [Alphaproteobacteria bacterium]|nr:M14 family metallocarboxypeptidase [Alphaproteobacteria bacterium]